MEHKAIAHGSARRLGRGRIRDILRKAMDAERWKKLLRGEASISNSLRSIRRNKEGDEAERQRKMAARDILGDLETYPGRVLMIYGTKDPEAEGSAAFFSRWMFLHGKEHETSWIEGANHNFYTDAHTREAIRISVAWLRDCLAARPQRDP